MIYVSCYFFISFEMEGWSWNGIGESDPANPNAYKHREIHVGPLYAQIVCGGEIVGANPVLDVIVKANEKHFAAWFKGESFDVDAFFEKQVYYSDYNPQEKKRKCQDFETATTKTSDYVSRFDVMKLVAAVNRRWNWDSSPDALRHVVVPKCSARRENCFHLVEEFDIEKE